MVKKAIKEEEEKRNTAMQSKYKGVRKRKWGKWVSEIRLPHSRERIWLGSYETPEKAARAFDAAQFCLRGGDADFNFPDNPPFISGGSSLTPPEIQEAAARFAKNTEDSVVVVVPGEESGLPGSEIRPESPSTSASVATSTVDCDLSFFDLIPSDFGMFPAFDYFSDGFSSFSGEQFTEFLPIEDYGGENLLEDSLFLWDF
ncbi:Ethylene-responsive transcription factor [Cardamine amara subsp. amara]|uniref:Ethylene-responsive transcription factor n=1 Tax=Cardamine amara subsp. amara TaxID=228776 RepID=A0ABD1BGV1_CARAN